MNKAWVVQQLLADKNQQPQFDGAEAFAPTNIALCKYWGKRNAELNLPATASLSISLNDKGTATQIRPHTEPCDKVILNGEEIDISSNFAQRTRQFLDLFRHDQQTFLIETDSNIPVAAGLASSACGFAALTLALNQLFDWQLTQKELSILARLGSGSACRSIWPGFVKWQCGNDAAGMDSYAQPIKTSWPELRIGLCLVDQQKKAIGSTEAMQHSVKTSPFYKAWPELVANDLAQIEAAIKVKDFELLGETSENNAIAMHATMQTAKPGIHYSQPESLHIQHHVRELRSEGLPVYFTQDAGPNIKLLFEQKDSTALQEVFSDMEIIAPFASEADHD